MKQWLVQIKSHWYKYFWYIKKMSFCVHLVKKESPEFMPCSFVWFPCANCLMLYSACHLYLKLVCISNEHLKYSSLVPSLSIFPYSTCFPHSSCLSFLNRSLLLVLINHFCGDFFHVRVFCLSPSPWLILAAYLTSATNPASYSDHWFLPSPFVKFVNCCLSMHDLCSVSTYWILDRTLRYQSDCVNHREPFSLQRGKGHPPCFLSLSARNSPPSDVTAPLETQPDSLCCRLVRVTEKIP